MLDGIIFDIDGTIWDSTGVVEKAWNEAAKKVGIRDVNITADQLKKQFGKPMEDIIDAMFPKEPEDKKKEIGELCFEYEHAFLKRESGEVYPDFEEALQELSRNHKLFIVSNCQAGYIETLLHATGFGPYFTDFTCPGDSGLLKADNIRLMMKRNHLKNVVYIGDTQMDADACKAAGVPIVYAAYGFGTVEKPDYVVNTPYELVGLIHQIDTLK